MSCFWEEEDFGDMDGGGLAANAVEITEEDSSKAKTTGAVIKRDILIIPGVWGRMVQS